jgi:hypothetical protein
MRIFAVLSGSESNRMQTRYKIELVKSVSKPRKASKIAIVLRSVDIRIFSEGILEALKQKNGLTEDLSIDR